MVAYGRRLGGNFLRHWTDGSLLNDNETSLFIHLFMNMNITGLCQDYSSHLPGITKNIDAGRCSVC